MAAILLVPMAVFFFILQLILCFRARRLWARLLPCILLLTGEGLCLLAYAACWFLESTGADIYGAVFAAVLYGMFLTVQLGGIALAWLIWFIVKSVQKMKK